MHRTLSPTRAARPARLVAARLAAALAAAALAGLPLGCRSAPEETTSFAAPLPAGAPSLRRVGPSAVRGQLVAALADRDARLLDACDASLRWFDAPSSRAAFPFRTGDFELTHERARASVRAVRDLLASAPAPGTAEAAGQPEAMAETILSRFEAWESVGWDGSGEVLFTGYYAPSFLASRTRTERFRVPIHRRPDDLVTDRKSGAPRGRRTADGRVVPYWTRGEIQDGDRLAGLELAWLENEFDAFLVHVNGSARLRLPDDSELFVGYAGKTDRPYASLGKAMIRDGLLAADRTSIPAMRDAFRRDPAPIIELMRENESFVFFTEYDGGEWPAGSLGVRVHAMASIATDKAVFPRGGPVLVDTRRRTYGRTDVPFVRLMLDQDTGGAITAPGRADLFMGAGAAAGILAGGQHATGRMIYLVLRDGATPAGGAG